MVEDWADEGEEPGITIDDETGVVHLSVKGPTAMPMHVARRTVERMRVTLNRWERERAVAARETRAGH